MDSTVLASIITSVCTLIGVILTVYISSAKQKKTLELKVKYQQHQIEEMKHVVALNVLKVIFLHSN